MDRIFVWTLDLEKGKLVANDPPSVPIPSGHGPRHFTFHPNGHWIYSLQEEASTVTLFYYDAESGRLSPRQTVSSLPTGFAGTNFASDLRISRDGRFLYAANRVHDSISWFFIGKDGTLAFVGEEWTRGDYPRSFSFDPTEKFLYCCNERADAVAIFERDVDSGKIGFTGRYVPVGSPVVILFLS
jgi:6-phosphogluconolactonase (cycloisomerase 2 family)